MLCPNCDQHLKEVKGVSHYGTTVKLNQCDNCGGIWFEGWTLFSLEEKEVKRLENIEVDKFRKSDSTKKEKLCPVCNLPLTRLKDPNIPESINIETCRKCSGFWMNHGETTKYKQYQEQKIKEGPPTPQKHDDLDGEIEKLLESDGSNDTLENIASILSTPIDRSTLMPIERIGKESKTTDKIAGSIAESAINILKMIFRSIIH